MWNQSTSPLGAVYIGWWDALGKAPMRNQMCLRTVPGHVTQYLVTWWRTLFLLAQRLLLTGNCEVMDSFYYISYQLHYTIYNLPIDQYYL